MPLITFIYICIIAIYCINIIWTWKSLGNMEKTKKVGIIAIELVAMYLLTTMIFFMSQKGIPSENKTELLKTKNILVAVFSGINGIIIIPQISKIMEKIINNDIEAKHARNRIIFWVIILIICMIFEQGYMKDTQEGILKVYQSLKK